MRKKITLFIIIILIIIGIILLDPIEFIKLKIEEYNFEEKVSIEEITNNSATYEEKMENLFKEYNNINEDTIGYIEIKELNISYPVMYSDISNEYYLYKDFEKNDSYLGSIYLDKYSEGIWGKINLIHGHHMPNDDEMFSNLKNLNNQETFSNSSKIINIFDGEKNREYEIFSINIVDATTTSVPLSYRNEEEYKNWLEQSLNNSTVKGGEIKNYDDILVLNTCDYSFETARILVLASRIK